VGLIFSAHGGGGGEEVYKHCLVHETLKFCKWHMYVSHVFFKTLLRKISSFVYSLYVIGVGVF
jgi:hypothetical protein